MPAKPSPALLAALSLAEIGIASFPCGPSKAPACPGGFKRATSDPASVRALFHQSPGELVGVPTGSVNGFDVLDGDLTKHDVAATWLTENQGRIPPTRTHRTRSGGVHIFFQHESGLRCWAARPRPGIDGRADGGYILWWPVAGYPIVTDAPLAKWPGWLLEEITPRHPEKVISEATGALDDRRLAGLARVVASAGEGQRNQFLFWAACRIAEAERAGNLESLDFAQAVLVEAASRAGLPHTEATRTVRSAMRGAGAKS